MVNLLTLLCSRNKGFKPKVIQEDVSKFLPPGFKVPEESEEQSLSINKIFPRIKPTEATRLKLKTDIPPPYWLQTTQQVSKIITKVIIIISIITLLT